MESGELSSLLKQALDALESVEWSGEEIQNALNGLLQTTGQKPGILFSLIRIATTWSQFSPQLNDTLALLGREHTIERLRTAIQDRTT